MKTTQSDILKMISIIYRKTQIFLNEETKAFDLSSATAPFIMITCENGRMVQSQFCEMLNMSKGTVAKTLARLEEQGFVTRVGSSEDLRSVEVYPTPKAMEAYPFLARFGEAWADRMTCGLTDVERAVFFDLLKKVSDNIEDYFEGR